MPVGLLLVLVRTAQQRALGEVRADQVQPDRQVVNESAGHRNRGQTRKVGADELKQSGWAQRLAANDTLEATTQALVEELLAVPPASLAMTRSLTSALGRSSSGMALGWADADLQQWAFTEQEYQDTVRRYSKGVGSKPGDKPKE